MNVNLEPPQFATQNIAWLDTKPNNIMSGNFTKVSYITPEFTMNGLYMQFPVDITTLEYIDDKAQMKFNPHSVKNTKIVKEYARIENKLLDNYMQCPQRKQSLKKVILLSKQLYSGFMKIYKESYANCPKKKEQFFSVKISGVWETVDSCGLTYKLYGGSKI
jgi:hypothetical protein